jgi:signal transduction histidine kinase
MMKGLRRKRLDAHSERADANFAARILACSAAFLVILLCFLGARAQAREPIPQTVLVLDQSGPDLMNPGYTELYRNLRSTLTAQSTLPITIYKENLDLDRFNDPRRVAILHRYVGEKYLDVPIGVLVAVGSAALRFALERQAENATHIPIVVAAADTESVVKILQSMESHSVTGRTLQFSLKSCIEAARVLVPGLKSIALIGDPLDRQAFRHHFKDELKETAASLGVIDLTGLSIPELRKRVASLPEDSAIVYTTLTMDGDRVTYLPNEGLEAFADAANRPIVADLDNRIGHGATGGSVVVPALMGREAAQLVWRLLNGEEASEIPITASAAHELVFDWRLLQRWGIDESSLPAGSEVRFRAPTIWDQYRQQIIAIGGVFLLQAMLIWWLIYEHRRRHVAEAVARTTMAELTNSNRMATAGELSASIAHEVNQPLTGIVTRANAGLRWLSAEKPDIGKARDALSQIVAAGHRASEVLVSVRAMFKKETVEEVPVNINDLIAAVLRLVRPDLERHRVRLDLQLSERLPRVLGNPVQLQQVILNLVMNAVESVGVAEVRWLSVKSEPDESGVRVSVEDSGTGIDPANVKRVFDPLFTTKIRGMGMGLSICRSIIENHHGRIWVTAAPVKGSIFQFVVPTTV